MIFRWFCIMPGVIIHYQFHAMAVTLRSLDSIFKSKLACCMLLNEPRHDKTCLCHMRTTKAQIGAFVFRCLDSLIPTLASAKIPRLN